MKRLLVLLCVACAVRSEAPYPPSGWKPSGPAFELPEKNSQPPQKQYLPPASGDPRNVPSDANPDVSVQGLPVEEQTPEFQVSPESGQQYVGPDFNADIARLNERYRQELFQIQQQRIQEVLKQQQPQNVPTTNPTIRTPAQIPNFKTTPKPVETTTIDDSLNEGEVNPDEDKVSVEISKQKIQEYPELLLTPLTQIRLAKNGQLIQNQKQTQGFEGPIHLAALQSILRQNQQVIQNQEVVQNQAFIAPQNPGNTFLIIPQNVNQQLTEPQYQIQPVLLQPQDLKYGVPEENPDVEEVEEKETQVYQPQVQLQPQPMTPQLLPPQPQLFQTQFQQFQPEQQPLTQFQTEQQQFLLQQQQLQLQQQQLQLQQQFLSQSQQFQPQPQQFQPQPQQFQPQAQQFQPQAQQFQPQDQQFQPQAQQFQPQAQQFQAPAQQFQPQTQQFQPQQNQYQPQIAPAQPEQFYQPQVNYQPLDVPQYYQTQQQVIQGNQGQGALQSGFKVDQNNGVEDKEETTESGSGDGSASAVATAFGARTRPRVLTQYGAPAPVPTTTEAAQTDEVELPEGGPAVAVATAEARGRRKSSKLRNRRVRPVFMVDQSGHLVLQDQ